MTIKVVPPRLKSFCWSLTVVRVSPASHIQQPPHPTIVQPPSTSPPHMTVGPALGGLSRVPLWHQAIAPNPGGDGTVVAHQPRVCMLCFLSEGVRDHGSQCGSRRYCTVLTPCRRALCCAHVHHRQAGVLWFLVTPALVLVAPMLGKVMRHRFVTAGSVIMQTSSLLMMCRLFLTSSTEYYKLSSMANMGTMLGACRRYTCAPPMPCPALCRAATRPGGSRVSPVLARTRAALPRAWGVHEPSPGGVCLTCVCARCLPHTQD